MPLPRNRTQFARVAKAQRAIKWIFLAGIILTALFSTSGLLPYDPVQSGNMRKEDGNAATTESSSHTWETQAKMLLKHIDPRHFIPSRFRRGSDFDGCQNTTGQAHDECLEGLQVDDWHFEMAHEISRPLSAELERRANHLPYCLDIDIDGYCGVRSSNSWNPARWTSAEKLKRTLESNLACESHRSQPKRLEEAKYSCGRLLLNDSFHIDQKEKPEESIKMTELEEFLERHYKKDLRNFTSETYNIRGKTMPSKHLERDYKNDKGRDYQGYQVGFNMFWVLYSLLIVAAVCFALFAILQCLRFYRRRQFVKTARRMMSAYRREDNWQPVRSNQETAFSPATYGTIQNTLSTIDTISNITPGIKGGIGRPKSSTIDGTVDARALWTRQQVREENPSFGASTRRFIPRLPSLQFLEFDLSTIGQYAELRFEGEAAFVVDVQPKVEIGRVVRPDGSIGLIG